MPIWRDSEEEIFTMDYQESLSYLDELAAFGMKPGLQRIRRLLELLDQPQERYRSIHVTGTNGKGSVSSMLARILRSSDIHVGLFTSPHLVSYTERIQIDGQPISESDFASCLSVVRVYAEQMADEDGESPTQFEVLTATAFFYFAIRHVEYAVIEAGLGGLLDSTNVIVPEAAVITNVTMEHADRCGGTLEGIAHHKAGIIKEGIPVVTAARGEALDIIRTEAEAKNSDIFVDGEDFSAQLISTDEHVQRLEFRSELLGVDRLAYELHLLGSYQIENSALAIMTATLLHNVNADERVTREHIVHALKLVDWPGRFERMDLGTQKILLDGAHNPAGMQALRASLDAYFPSEQRIFLLGILKDKEIDVMLETLLRPDDVVIVSTPASERAAAPEMVAREAGRIVRHAEAVADQEQALRRALELANGEHLLVAAGSLYLIGELRRILLKM